MANDKLGLVFWPIHSEMQNHTQPPHSPPPPTPPQGCATQPLQRPRHYSSSTASPGRSLLPELRALMTMPVTPPFRSLSKTSDTPVYPHQLLHLLLILEAHPSLLIKSSLGLHSQVHQALLDQGLAPDQFGKGANKGEGCPKKVTCCSCQHLHKPLDWFHFHQKFLFSFPWWTPKVKGLLHMGGSC